MKQLLLTIFTVCAATSFAQIDFSINGQQVDNSIQQQVTLGNSAGFEAVDLSFHNVSGSVVNWGFEICVLFDDPNIEFTDFTWVDPSNQFFGIHVPASTSPTNPCQSIGGIHAFDVEDGDSAMSEVVFDLSGTGCETHRYYLIENGMRQDSIDIQYCSVLSLEEIVETQTEIHPNPANSMIQIHSELTLEGVEVTDVQGKSLIKEELSNVQEAMIPTGALPEGIYLVQVYFADDLRVTRRIQVVH